MKKLLFTSTLLLTVALLASCQSFSKTEESAENSQAFFYRLRGEGPDGTAFGWKEVNSQYVVLTDLRIGQWTLFAEKLDSKGNKIAAGEITAFITDASQQTEIPFTSGGYGDVLCSVSWGKQQCQEPSLSIFILTEEGEWFPRPKEEIEITEDGEAIWKANGMLSGSYLAKVLLYDGKKQISGAVSALRVVDGYVSTGEVRLTVGCLEKPYGVRIGTDPVFEKDGSIVIEGINARYLDVNGKPTDVTWYVNGIEEEKGDFISLKIREGNNCFRIDAVTNSTPKSSSSITVWLKESGLVLLGAEEDSSIGFGN